MSTLTRRTYGQDTYGSGYYGYGPQTDPRPAFVVDVQTDTGWVDVTCDVRAIQVESGRSTYYEAFKAGTCAITLADFREVYSAFNPFGVLAASGGGKYRSDVPVRVRLSLPDGMHSLFAGTIDAVVTSWPNTTDAVTGWSATDAFKQLARYNGLARTAVGAGETSGARVNRFLTDAQYTGPRAVDVGISTMAATDLSGVALDNLRKTGEAEWGWLYTAADGTLTFRQRDALQTDPRMVNVQYTFTDGHDVPGACYAEIALRASDDEVYNVATIGRTGGTPATTQDAASVAWFGPRTYTRTDLPLADDSQSLTVAQTIVLEYANNDRRIDSVSFDAMHPTDPAYAVAAGIRINDRVRVVRRPPGGHSIDAELLVQGIKHEITAGGDGFPLAWKVTVATADALLVREYGQWDVALWDTDKWGV